jgi:hypothetical protein
VPAEQVPCSWDPIPCGCSLAPSNPTSPDPGEVESIQYAVESASFVLWALSGRQFGCCELTFRPCRRDCSGGSGGGAWGAYLSGGKWYNASCRQCATTCACSEVSEVRLAHAPACSVTAVIADGMVLPPAGWRLEDDEWVVLTEGAFPECQDMTAPLGDPGTWGIVYEYGQPPPTAGRRAVGSLACEILKACRSDASCCLPKRTQQYTRQGITVAMLDPFDFFEKGRTGIYEVDLFLMAVNPQGRPSGARVMSPDSEPRARNVWPAGTP